MGKVTISTVLGYKEYVVENIKNIRGEDEENSDFRIYPDYHKIYRGQTEIVLTKAEYELFMLLSGRPGVIFTKEKIFDASFWILLAALFHFWSIFYIVLVFIAIILHVSKDYRNWVIPFIALFAVTILFFLANSLLDNSLMSTLLSKTYVSFDFYYFDNIYQRLALALFASLSLFAFVLHVFDIPNKALNMQSSHKTILFSFIFL